MMKARHSIGLALLISLCGLTHGQTSVTTDVPYKQKPAPHITMTPEQMTTEMVRAAMSDFRPQKISTPRFNRMGDGVAIEVLKIMGTRGPLSRDEQIAVLALLHQAYERPAAIIRPSLRAPQATLFLLQYIESSTQDQSVKQMVSDVKQFVTAAATADVTPPPLGPH